MNNLNFFALKNRATGNYYGFPTTFSVSTHPIDENDTDSVYDLHTKCWVKGVLDCKQFETKESAQSFLNNKKTEFARLEKNFDPSFMPFGFSTEPEYDLLNCDIMNINESVLTN